MIIDLRTRISASAEAHCDSSSSVSHQAHRAAMRCVDASVIVGQRCERLGVHVPAEAIAAHVNEDPARRLGFAGIDPMLDSALDDVARAVDLGMAGVTISPADQGCRVTHDRCLAVLERCAHERLPVLVANPMLMHPESVLEFARPATLDEAVRLIPGLTLVLGDFGKAWLEEALLLIGKHPRVYAEISGVVARPWSLYTALIAAHERGVMHKLLFGSGFPSETPERAIERIYTINNLRNGASLPTIPRESLRQIVERDALACLGVDHIFQSNSPERAPLFQEPVQVVVKPANGLLRSHRTGGDNLA